MQSDRIYWRTPAYRSAVAHPFHVSAFASWADHEPVTVGFQTEDDARAFASIRPEPIIDLVKRDCGPIAARRMLAHPSLASVGCENYLTGEPAPNGPRDDFPELRP